MKRFLKKAKIIDGIMPLIILGSAIVILIAVIYAAAWILLQPGIRLSEIIVLSGAIISEYFLLICIAVKVMQILEEIDEVVLPEDWED